MRSPSALALSALLIAASSAFAQPVPEDRLVESVDLWIEGGARPDYSTQGDFLAYDRRGSDGLYDVYLVGTNGGGERCLTCEIYQLRKSSSFGATWHPSGDRLIVQVQQPARRLSLEVGEMITPHRSVHTELYLIRRDGKDLHQLSRFGDIGSAFLNASFSFEGDRVLFGQRTKAREGRYGAWELKTSSLSIGRAAPKLGRIKGYTVSAKRALVIPQEFLPDESGVLLVGNLEDGHSERGLDIYVFDFDSKKTERLTHSRNVVDENAHISPDGEKIVWTTDSELPLRVPRRALNPTLRRDLWIMDRDGSGKERLTYFNHLTAAEGLGQAHVGDFDWSASGDEIAAHVVTGNEEVGEAIYKIRLARAFR